jgi:hypothetical protein
MTTDVLGGPVRDALQLSELVEVGGNDMHDKRGGGGCSGSGGYWL